MSLSKTITFSETAEVSFSILTDTEIDYYIEHFNPMDKAGAYGIQDWIGLCRVQSIRGTFSNIMGLPMARLYEELMKF
jgi:septum formation protein